MKRRLQVVMMCVAIGTVSAAYPSVVFAAPCYVDGGTINASDEDTWVGGTDAPTPDKAWGPFDYRHDMLLAEWCEPGHDWLRDREIYWSSSAMAIVQERWTNHRNFMVFEQHIKDEWQYNNRNNTTSNLPYVWYYVADIFEQASQHYEEAGWWMKERTPELVAGKDYYAYAQWDQEKSPLDPPNGDHGGFRRFASMAEILKPDWYAWDGIDRIGLSTSKKYNQ